VGTLIAEEADVPGGEKGGTGCFKTIPGVGEGGGRKRKLKRRSDATPREKKEEKAGTSLPAHWEKRKGNMGWTAGVLRNDIVRPRERKVIGGKQDTA